MIAKPVSSRKALHTLAAVLIAVLIPTAAHANMGTPLMWASMFHLSIGNVLIGVLEGYVIVRCFKLKNSPYLTMVAANYFSAVMGIIALTHAGFMGWRSPEWVTIYNAHFVIRMLWVISYLLTMVLEWPFVFRLFKGRERRFRSSILATILSQTVSYTALLLFFGSVSIVRLDDSLSLDKSSSFASDMHATVYFISPHDGNVYRVRPGDASPHLAFITNDHTGRVFIRARISKDSGGDYGVYDLCYRKHGDEIGRVLIKSAAKVVEEKENRLQGAMPDVMSPLDFRTPAKRKYEISTGYFPESGLTIREENGDSTRTMIAVASPMMGWLPGYATVLTNDYVVFSLGHQILVVDMNRHKVGLLAIGEYPVAVPDSK